MYIGPWQEFKLARILQLKEKVDREEQEANQITFDGNKAYSVGTGARGQITSSRANAPFSGAASAFNPGKVDSAAGSDFFMKRKMVNANMDSYSNYSHSNMFMEPSNDGRTANTTNY